MEHLLELQLYNLFQDDKVIAWDDLLRIMSGTFGRNRDEVFAGMNELLNDGRVVMPNGNTYCRPGTLAKIQKKEQENRARRKAFPDGKEMTRADFEKLPYAERAAYCRNGGRIAG